MLITANRLLQCIRRVILGKRYNNISYWLLLWVQAMASQPVKSPGKASTAIASRHLARRSGLCGGNADGAHGGVNILQAVAGDEDHDLFFAVQQARALKLPQRREFWRATFMLMANMWTFCVCPDMFLAAQ